MAVTDPEMHDTPYMEQGSVELVQLALLIHEAPPHVLYRVCTAVSSEVAVGCTNPSIITSPSIPAGRKDTANMILTG